MPSEDAPAGPPVRVLLVDDDDDNRELMGELLELAGFAVARAGSGAEALAALAAAPVDVLVTDVGMPGMGGLELARAAKRLAPAVPVIAVTGWGERGDVADARGHEIDAILVKPVDPDALTNTVREVARRATRA